MLLENVSAASRLRFQDLTHAAGAFFQRQHRGRGMALGDLDNDGRTDLVISQVNEPVVLLRNIAANGHHWLGVALEGAAPRDAVGARLTLEVGDKRQVRTIKGGGSYASANDPRIVFGLVRKPAP